MSKRITKAQLILALRGAAIALEMLADDLNCEASDGEGTAMGHYAQEAADEARTVIVEACQK